MNELRLYPDGSGGKVIVYNKKVYSSYEDIKLPPISRDYFTKFTGIWRRRLETNKRMDIAIPLSNVRLVGVMAMDADYTTQAQAKR